METCKTIVLAQPDAGSSINYEIPTNETAQLSFSPEQISGLSLNDAGGLVIRFVDGGQVTITNFQDMTNNGNFLFLSDGTTIDPNLLMGALKGNTGEGTDTSGIITIVSPSENSTREITMEPGKKYVFDFDFAEPQNAEIVNGDLVISFANQGLIVLKNYESVMGGTLPAELSIASSDTIISGEELLISLQNAQSAPEENILAALEEPQPEEAADSEVQDADFSSPEDIGPGDQTAQTVAKVEPAAGEEDLDSIAEKLQQVEPAAGETQGPDGSEVVRSRDPNASGFDAPDDIGPINPTALQYDLPEFGDDRLDELNLGAPSPAVVDDQPIMSEPDDVRLDESDLGPLVANGQVTVDFGNDGPGTIAPNGDVTVDCSVAGGVLSSGGVPVVISQTANGYEGVAGGVVVFTLTIDPATGAYTYTQLEPFDHADSSDPNDEICLHFGVVATDSDGDATTTQISIIVADDAPLVLSQTPQTLDETNLNGGNPVLMGTFFVDAGNDTSAMIMTNDTFNASGSLAGGALTSGGVPVVVTSTANGYTGTANGVTVFTLTIDPNTGVYTFTQFEALDHADGSNPNDVITLSFGAKVTDFDGDQASGTIVINVLDDAPVLGGPAVETIDETNLGPIVETGSVSVDFGNDGKGEVTLVDGSFAPSGSLAGGALTSGGVPVVVTLVNGEYVGTANGETVFTLSIDSMTGAYTFTLLKPLDHADASNPDDVITLNFGVQIEDFDGDTATTTIIINIKDDAPDIFPGDDAPQIGAGLENVDETNLSGGNLVRSGTVPIDFGTDAPGTAGVNGSFTPSGSLAGGALTSGGVPVVVTASGNTYTGTANGVTVFTLQFNPATGQYTYTQFEPLDHADGSNPNDVITLQFGITVTDADGDTDSGVITINVADDAPDAKNDTATVEEGQSVSGNVTTNDDGGEDSPSTVVNVRFNGVDFPVPATGTVNVPGQFGTLTIAADGSFTYTVTDTNNPDGQDVFFYTLRDSDGDTDVAKLAIDVTPDMTPVISSDVKTIDETNLTGGVIMVNGALNPDFMGEGPGTVGGNGAFSASGSLLGGQLTHNGVPISVTLAGNTYTGTAGGVTVFTLQVNNDGTYSFKLFENIDHADGSNPNDIIALQFGVVATDADGDTATTTITINVKDDVPTISDRFKPVDEGDLENGPLMLMATVPHSFGQDGAGEIIPTGKFSAQFQVGGQNQPLTSNGVEIVVTATANGYVGMAGNDVIFTLDINPATGKYVYKQFAGIDHPDGSNPDDVIWLKFEVQIVDFDGDTDTAIIGIDVHDDGPVAHDDTDTVTETEGSTSGDVTANDDAGADQPGTVTKISFGGQDVYLQNGTAMINGTYGTLNINADGSYTYTLTNPNVPNTAQEVFSYMLSDADGDMDTATLTINVEGFDDHPTIGNSVFPVHEGDLANGPVMVMRNLTHDFGDDGAGQIKLNGTFMLLGNSSTQTGELTSNGDKINVTFSGNTATGTATDGRVVFTLSVDPATGKHTFTLFEPLDHGKPGQTGASDVVWIKFGVDIMDSDGDTATGMIQVDIRDDGPSVEGVSFVPDETNLKDGPIMITKKLGFDFGEDGAGTIRPTGNTFTSTEIGGPSTTLTHMGIAIVIAATATGYVAKAGATTIFTLDIDPATGFYTYKQFDTIDHINNGTPNNAVWVKLEVEIVDFDGDTAREYIQIDILDDAPFARTDLNMFDGSMADGNVLSGVNGGPNGSDILSQDDPTLVTKIAHGKTAVAVDADGATIDGDFGQLVINPDGSYKYTLFDGGQKETIYKYVVTDPSHNPAGGDIQKIDTSFNATTNEFTFSLTVSDPAYLSADGFTLAINGGPNPKGNPGEMALIYFDASGGQPVVTIYGYSGQNNQNSYFDGSPATGVQAPDKIASSLLADNPFISITEGVDAYGNKVFSFTIDASVIQNHIPLYGDPADWTGVAFGDQLGMWLHPVANLHTAYGQDGYLTEWDDYAQGWYDVAYKPTEVEHFCPPVENVVDIFEYMVTDFDGDMSTAYLIFNNGNGQAFNGTHLADTLTGTALDDALYGAAGNDVLFGGEGADTFLFLARHDGMDTVKDFDLSEGDRINLSELLENYDPVSEAIEDFVFVTHNGGNTIISVDQNGSGNIANAFQVATLEGAVVSLNDLTGNNALVA